MIDCEKFAGVKYFIFISVCERERIIVCKKRQLFKRIVLTKRSVSGTVKSDLSRLMRQSAVTIVTAGFPDITGIAFAKNAWKSPERFRLVCVERSEALGRIRSVQQSTAGSDGSQSVATNAQTTFPYNLRKRSRQCSAGSSHGSQKSHLSEFESQSSECWFKS